MIFHACICLFTCGGGGGCVSFGLRAACVHTHVQKKQTALTHAIAKGHTDCVLLLLDAGADKEAQDWVRRVGRLRL